MDSTHLSLRLRPFVANPLSDDDLADLRAHRVACGWGEDCIPGWVEQIKTGHRLMWFIQPPCEIRTKSIGTVSLNMYDPTDLSIADFRAPSPGTRVEICALFVYPEYRRCGVGKTAIMEVERVAREMGAATVTMNTSQLSENLERYQRMGYKEYKDRELKYSIQECFDWGLSADHAIAAFLEKQIGQVEAMH